MLGVLDPPAQVAAGRVAGKDLLVDVQHFAVRAVTDRVNVHLEAVTERDP